MPTTTATKLATGDSYFAEWLAEVKTHFPISEEFELAAEIYSFAAAFEDGKSPAEAYEDFDRWTQGD